ADPTTRASRSSAEPDRTTRTLMLRVPQRPWVETSWVDAHGRCCVCGRRFGFECAGSECISSRMACMLRTGRAIRGAAHEARTRRMLRADNLYYVTCVLT